MKAHRAGRAAGISIASLTFVGISGANILKRYADSGELLLGILFLGVLTVSAALTVALFVFAPFTLAELRRRALATERPDLTVFTGSELHAHGSWDVELESIPTTYVKLFAIGISPSEIVLVGGRRSHHRVTIRREPDMQCRLSEAAEPTRSRVTISRPGAQFTFTPQTPGLLQVTVDRGTQARLIELALTGTGATSVRTRSRTCRGNDSREPIGSIVSRSSASTDVRVARAIPPGRARRAP